MSNHQSFQLPGVVDDGSTLAPGVVSNTATTITVARFGTVQVDVELVNNAGVPVKLADLAAGWTSHLTIQKSLDDCQRLAEVRVTGAPVPLVSSGNLLRFVVGEAEFRKLSSGRWFFDVWVLGGEAGARWQVVRPGAFVVLAGTVPG